MSQQRLSAFRRLRCLPLSCIAPSSWRTHRLPSVLVSSTVRNTSFALSCRLCHGQRSAKHSSATESDPSSASSKGATTPTSTTSVEAAFITTAANHVITSSPPATTHNRFRCPECGKRFLCAANLLQHRTRRHGHHVETPQDAAHANLVAQNAALQRELTRLRARVKQLREEKPPSALPSPTATKTSQLHDPPVATELRSSVEGLEGTKTYPSAILTGQLMEVEPAVWRAWQQSGCALGTGVSSLNCVGTVRGPVQIGRLSGSGEGAGAPRLLQFTLEVHGYRERRPGQLKMYRAHMLVRYIPSQPYHRENHNVRKDNGSKVESGKGVDDEARGLFSVKEGDLLRVQGHYGLHNSYDMISKLPVENVVVEADYIGLLRSVDRTETVLSSQDTEANACESKFPELSSAPKGESELSSGTHADTSILSPSAAPTTELTKQAGISADQPAALNRKKPKHLLRSRRRKSGKRTFSVMK